MPDTPEEGRLSAVTTALANASGALRNSEEELATLKVRLLAAESLVREVLAWHGDPLSPDYNGCDIEPCFWCERAKKTVSVHSDLLM